MRKIAKYSRLIPLTALALLVVSCTDKMEEEQVPAAKGSRAYAEVTLNNTATAETRAMRNTYDGWSVSRFNDTQKDVAGMYAVRGRQNEDDMDKFERSMANVPMYYEGLVSATTNSYRFGNSAYILDATTVGNYVSIMYYPYYEDMPDPWDSTVQQGLWLRQEDSGMEKCIDFMCTSGSLVSTYYSYIPISNGVMSPVFYHYFVNLVVQRGDGFQNAPCRDIWIVMQNPCTDLRIKRANDLSNTSGSFTYYLQYTPGGKDGTETDEMIDLMDEVRKVDTNAANLPESEQEHYTVNKYAVWKTWEASAYNGKESRYAIIPPGSGRYLNSTSTSSSSAASFGKVAFILIQDNNGKWQRVSDFYLYGVGYRYGGSGYRYVLTITLEGVRVVVRPTLEDWEDEVEVTDIHKVGISDYADYKNWVGDYNLYVENQRSSEYHERLQKYGDVVEHNDGSASWTFYINHDIDFPPSDEFPVIDRLEDVLEGTSTYTTYKMSNLQGPLINTIGEKGLLRALEFNNVYLVQSKSDVNQGNETEFASQPYAALTRELAGGKIEKCHVDGVLFSTNPAGMIAGKVSNGGTVENCNVSGNVFGSSTAEGYGGLFGIVEEGTPAPTMPGTQYGGLKFIEN